MALTYLRQSRTCHTLKELEKALPSVASVNSVTVKDLVKDLTDESKIKVEKIGTGNWYWVFPSEEKRERERILQQLEYACSAPAQCKSLLTAADYRAEKEAVEIASQNLQDRLDKLNTDKEDAQADTERQGLLSQVEPLKLEIDNLGHEIDGLNDALSGSINGMREAITKWKLEAGTWTDNIHILEGYFRSIGMLDSETMEALHQECYGTEYVEREGLKDLEDI